jgi:hypothetical protein
MDRSTMLREQARLLRDLAAAGDESPEIRERLRALAEECEELAKQLERSPGERH